MKAFTSLIIKYSCLIALFLPLCGYAAETNHKTLSKSLVLSFLQVSKELTVLGQTSPKLVEYLTKLQHKNNRPNKSELSRLAIYPKLSAVLAQSEFDSVEEVFQFSKRIMGIAYYSKMQSSDEADIFQTVGILRANILTMKANFASQETIERAEAILAEQELKAALVQENLDLVTEEDKRFLEQNMDWLNQQFGG